MLSAVTAWAQSKVVSGTVVDDTNQPLPGVAVTIPGTTTGTVTDFDGKYSLNAGDGQKISFSFIGYATVEEDINGRSTIDVQMVSDAMDLEDVVVVGYGVQKKKLVTGATVQVKGDELAQMNTTNALSAMQSVTPGVQITQSSAQPGKGFKVSIRGVGTMGTSSPLLVIDGVSSGTADDGLNGLNPADIESIDVLKDAASAAIYGARAANGVILVTTKQGKAGKLVATYDGYVGISNPYKRPATLDAQEYMKIIDETNFNSYGTKTDWASLVPKSILDEVNNGWEGTDWFDLYRNENAVQTNHSFNLTGGSDRSKFSLGLNYTSNDGIFGGDNYSDYKRYGGRINSEHVVIKSDHDVLTIGENISFWYNTSHDLAEGNGYWNIMQNAYIASPLVKAYDEDGNLTNYNDNGAGYSSMIYTQPLAGLYNGEYSSINRTHNIGVGATFYWIIEPIKGLRYRGSFNTGYSASTYRYMGMPYSESNTNASSNYSTQQTSSVGGTFQCDNTISYELPEIGSNHFDIMVGQSFEKNKFGANLGITTQVSDGSQNTLLNRGFDYAWPSNYTADNITGFYGNPWGDSSIASFFGRLNWNLNEKYMATVTFRADGSSNFARGHRWGYFPSASAGWVISEEGFMDATRDVLSNLKIRASWGQNGNCNVDNFQYLASIASSPTDYADYGYKFSSDISSTINGSYQSGAYASRVPNEDLTWETSEQLNIGLDARFLDSRLGLTFDWYKKTTKDWLIQAPQLAVQGTGAPYINGGDIENKGFEIALSWNDVAGDDFHYHVNVNLGYNKNEVTKIANNQGLINGETSALFQNSDYVSRVQVDHPIAYFYGMSYSGIWQNQAQIDQARADGKAVLDGAQPGDMIWDDYDGDGVINYDNDRHEIGDPNPDVTLGVTLGFEFKGFDFSASGAGQFGMQVMQCYRTALLANQYSNYTQDVFERWHGEGTSNSQPRLAVGGENNQWVSTRYMQDADFFRIQNITLGYDFTTLWQNSPFSQLRLYVQAQNLYTFTDYTGVDPEVGSSGGKDSWARGIDVGLYPSARTYLAGVNIKF